MPIPSNRVERLERVSGSTALFGQPGVEIELVSSEPFPAQGELPMLHIGVHDFGLSRYPPSGDLHVLIFTLTPAQFAALDEGAPIRIQYGTAEAPATRAWHFGPLRKSSASAE